MRRLDAYVTYAHVPVNGFGYPQRSFMFRLQLFDFRSYISPKGLDVSFLRGVACSSALRFCHPLPSRGNSGNSAFVNGAYVSRDESGQDRTRHELGSESFRKRLVEDPTDQLRDAITELGAELLGRYAIQSGQSGFFMDRTDKRKTITIRKEGLDRRADLVLGLNAGAATCHGKESGFQVVLGGDFTAVLLEAKVEITKKPKEARGKFTDAVLTLTSLHPDVLSHFCDQRKTIQSGFVDASHLIVQEETG
mmetsp:Transcript_1950/g.2904  ORF Transcript_1950/g.2904 Transcript_1950/m.2904 type:complete len:250 (-) Transcript_1950:419-1168(-)